MGTTVERATNSVTEDLSPAERTLPSTQSFSARTMDYADTAGQSLTGQAVLLPHEFSEEMEEHPVTQSPTSRRRSAAHELSIRSRSPERQAPQPEPELSVLPPERQQSRTAAAQKWLADSLAGRCSKARSAFAWAAVGLLGAGAIASVVGLALSGFGLAAVAGSVAYFVAATGTTGLATIVGGVHGHLRGGNYEREVSTDTSWVKEQIGQRFDRSDWPLAEHVLEVHREHFDSPGDHTDRTLRDVSEEALDNMTEIHRELGGQREIAENCAKFWMGQTIETITGNSDADGICEQAAELTFQRYLHTSWMGTRRLDADNLRNDRESLLEHTAQAVSESKAAETLREQLPKVLGTKSDFCRFYSALFTLAEQNQGNAYGRVLADMSDTLRETILQTSTAFDSQKTVPIGNGLMSAKTMTVEERLDELERPRSKRVKVPAKTEQAIRRHLPKLVTARVMMEARTPE